MIVLEDVRKIYEPNVTALDGVSFVIDKGEFVFVVGASGSGKSTIIRLLLKELEPTSGRILVGGRDLGTAQALEDSAPPPECRLRISGLQAVAEPHCVRKRRVRLARPG